MSGWHPTATQNALHQQATLRNEIRGYMLAQNVLEVVTPALSAAAATDVHIDSVSAGNGFLHTSPEFPMKRLLAAYGVDIFQIAGVFRAGEQGRFHNAEFSLLEWYRVGFTHHQLMQDMQALLEQLFTRFERPWHSPNTISYVDTVRQALALASMSSHAGFKDANGGNESAAVNPMNKDELNNERLLIAIKEHFAAHSRSYPVAIGDDINASLDLFMDEFVIPTFAKDRITFVIDYPASQAALAKVGLNPAGVAVAERFEVYWGSLELANGYHELTDAEEQRRRFEQDNRERNQRGLSMMPIDEHLVDALNQGLPDCAGVAMGLERLLMLLGCYEHIHDVLAFPTDRA